MESRYTEDMVIRRCEKEKWVLFAESLEGRNLSALLITCWNFSLCGTCGVCLWKYQKAGIQAYGYYSSSWNTQRTSNQNTDFHATSRLNCWIVEIQPEFFWKFPVFHWKSQSKVLAFQWIKKTHQEKHRDSWLIQHSSSGYHGAEHGTMMRGDHPQLINIPSGNLT